LNNKKEDIPLARLADIEKMSGRAYYVCLDYKFDSVFLLIEHFRKYGTFIKLRKCGEATNKELSIICEKYDGYFPRPPKPKIIPPENEFEKLYHSLSVRDLSIFSNSFDVLFNELSVRPKKALLRINKNKMDLAAYVELIVKPGHKFITLPNVGLTSSNELSVFHERLFNLLQKFNSQDTDPSESDYGELLVEMVKVSLKTNFNVDVPDTSDLLMVTKEKKFIPVFKIIEYLIHRKRLFHRKYDLFLFEHYFGYFLNTDLKRLKEISGIFNVSAQVVKNRISTFNTNFQVLLPFIKDLPLENETYEYYLKCDFINITKDVAKRFNDMENVNYSPSFYLKIFELILSESHELLCFRPYLLNRASFNGEDNKYYLVHKRILKSFDFVGFLKDIWGKKNSNEPHFFKFSDYVTNFFFKKKKAEDIKMICDICSTILFEFLGKKVALESYVYMGYRNFTVLSEKEASIICETDDLVMYSIRNKRNKIRHITRELLQKFNKPLYIGLIVIHVCKYINTTKRNIFENIYRNKKTFLLCGEGYVSLEVL
jgi:hypothetical protein